MSFITEDQLRDNKAQSLAPMIDFLFLMLMFFASLAISRVTTRETEVDLVEVHPEETSIAENSNEYKVINITITEAGEYKWVTEIRDYAMETPDDIRNELVKQYHRGLLPKDKTKTQVLLRIDRKASWDPILKVIFAVRDAGFAAHPLYVPETGEG